MPHLIGYTSHQINPEGIQKADVWLSGQVQTGNLAKSEW